MKDDLPSSIGTIDWQKAQAKKISVRIDGHATSISLEQAYIDILLQEANKLELSFASLVTLIDETRPCEINLSAALRLLALKLAKNI
ncbi:ribbon-helix-helix domain-containing protein [Bartonella apis]|uniref:ribbon-helix-helix domain-containing protein n=1 Tax=Bartonella apis TaxID=1686310 RepID=UPI00298E6D74|nr:ribbon-helix-helix domain-containing protein [Bartonella apis]